MKKILIGLLLLQNIYVSGQTETLVTINGKKVQVDTTPQWSLDGNTNTGEKSLGTKDNLDFPIITNNSEKMRITSDGQVLINTTTPLAGEPNVKMQINGVLQIVDGSQGQNKVLTSDANGVATWKISAVNAVINEFTVAHPAAVPLPCPPGASAEIGPTFTVPVSGMYSIFTDFNVPPGYIMIIGGRPYHYSQSNLRFYQHTLVFLEAGENVFSIYNDGYDCKDNPPPIGGDYWTFNISGPVN